MATEQAEQNQMGKRYECQQCGTVLMCIRSGAGRLTCHELPMTIQNTKPLPSSD